MTHFIQAITLKLVQKTSQKIAQKITLNKETTTKKLAYEVDRITPVAPSQNVKNNIKPQRGFALLTVLLVVALVSLVTSELLYEQEVQIKRSGFMIHQAHSLSVGYGFEGWVKTGLKADADDNQTDHLNEQWAQPLPPVDFEGGLVSGEMFDLQGRLNLNNVLETDATKQKFWQAAIERFLQKNLSSTETARDFQGFADVLLDWVDSDDEPRDYGVESATYLLKQPAYRAANQPLVMVSELQNLQGMENVSNLEIYRLSSYLTALPVATAINVNTADKLVLSSLTDWLTEDIVEQWLQQRQQQPAEEVAEFINFLITATGFTQAEIEKALPKGVLAVKTDYFLLTARVDYGDVQQIISSIFRRDGNNPVTLVQRWLSVV